MGEYATGDIVICSRGEEQHLGRVVGALAYADGMLYEVSLEDIVAKGVLAEELAPATAEVVRAVLGWYAQDPSLTLVAEPSLDLMRRWALRESYLAFLRSALLELEGAQERADAPAHRHMRFAVGDVVAARHEGAWLLATVRGTGASPRAPYTVDALGELLSLTEEDILPLEAVPAPPSLRLGARARFVAAGHEADAAYRGTVCMAREEDDAWEYGLMFDDGDVLEGLGERDLVPVRE